MSNERDELEECFKAYGIGHVDSHVLADALVQVGYRKTEPLWADTLTNDGKYEYTVSSDCDGSNVQHWRRVPGKTYIEAAAPWETYEPNSGAE